jgi:hypothetical protein
VEAVDRGRDLVLPVAFLAAAWLARGVFQGAACHFLHQQLLENEPPNAMRSLKAALYRLPSLCTTAAVLMVTPVLTLGLSYFFMGSLFTSYALTMRGEGSSLGLFAQTSRALGPARGSAVLVRIMFWVQLLVFWNLH